ncbi:hypothetical protein [Micromonospora sp. NPDC023956]|uniref:hypothetical protein n=1 Tax=Micromonospora sp. NPDC023956 TaxID=3155722 RepID=UPI0033D38459
MTAGRFGEVDLDLLADYVGGALNGTPDEPTVARLVAEDPAWARAHDELAAATARVGTALAAWGASTPAMPETVAERLTAVLAGAGPAAPATVPVQASPSTAVLDSASAGGSSRTVAVVGASPRPDGPGRNRRRWSRRTAPVLVAAAAMVAVGFGVTQLVVAGAGQRDAGSAQENAAAGDAPPGGFRLTTAPTRTGTSYTPDTVGKTSVGPGLLSTDGASPTGQRDPESEPRRSATDTGLDRLTARAALDTCLTAVGAAHGRGRITVDRVEYAAFQGAPALVVGLLDAGGERWVVVTGPECGVPGSGADTRYRARVG